MERGAGTPAFVGGVPGSFRAQLLGSRNQRSLGSLDVWRRRRWFEASGFQIWLTRFCSRGCRTPSLSGWPSEVRGGGSTRGGGAL